MEIKRTTKDSLSFNHEITDYFLMLQLIPGYVIFILIKK